MNKALKIFLSVPLGFYSLVTLLSVPVGNDFISGGVYAMASFIWLVDMATNCVTWFFLWGRKE